MRADHDSYKRLHIDLRALGLRARRFHDFRRAGITLYRDAGANKDVLRLCTHGGTGDVLEQYPWTAWTSALRSARMTTSRIRSSATPTRT